MRVSIKIIIRTNPKFFDVNQNFDELNFYKGKFTIIINGLHWLKRHFYPIDSNTPHFF